MKFKKQKYDKNIRVEFDTMKAYVPKKTKFKFVIMDRAVTDERNEWINDRFEALYWALFIIATTFIAWCCIFYFFDIEKYSSYIFVDTFYYVSSFTSFIVFLMSLYKGFKIKFTIKLIFYSLLWFLNSIIWIINALQKDLLS